MRKKNTAYRRAVRVSLDFATKSKRKKLVNFIGPYRAAVNFYIRSLWEKRGKLDAETLARLPKSRLTERQKSQALKQALETVIGTKKSAKALGKRCSMPVFRGSAILDAKFVSVEKGEKSFDLVVKLSVQLATPSISKQAYERISVPTCKTAVLNKWLAMPGAVLVQGCALNEHHLILWVEFPKPAEVVAAEHMKEPLLTPMKEGYAFGGDIGKLKLIALVSSKDSAPQFLGTGFSAICDKILRRKKGSKGRQRAYAERDNYIGFTVNQIPWEEVAVFGHEDLRGLKHGKKKNRSRAFRRAFAPCVCREVLKRCGYRCEEHRVLRVSNPPAWSSTTCPACGKVSKLSRKGEKFRCDCGYSGDADSVGATNVLDRTLWQLRSVESLRHDGSLPVKLPETKEEAAWFTMMDHYGLLN